MAELKNYRGNCHCTAFVYEIQVPEIKSAAECNCSICSRKGYLWVFPGQDNFQVVKGSLDELTSYTFGQKKMEHKFCGKCGTGLMAMATKEGADAGMSIGINVHAIQGLNSWDLEKKPFDGKAMDPPFKAHSHTGPLPETTVENGVLQTGSCHCGAVTVALNVPPLDSTYPEKIVECNCSICERNAYIWIYPPIPQVSLHAKDPADLVLYHFARGLLNKTFCRKCGVSITNQYRPESEGTEDPDWPDFVKEWVPMAKRLKAVNVRVLDGVDLKGLPEAERSTGGKWPPFYKNP